MIDLYKDEKQDELLELWGKAKGFGGIEAPPRFGKTKIGFKACDRHYNKFHKSTRIAIIVPNQTIKDQWYSAFSDFPHDKESYKIFTIREVSERNLKYKASLIIIDEAHKYTNPKTDAYKVLTQKYISSNFILILTGSYTRELEKIYPKVATVSLEESVEKEWIAKHHEFNISVGFTNEELQEYIEYTDYIKDTLEAFKNIKHRLGAFGLMFDNDFDVILHCSADKRVRSSIITASETRTVVAQVNGWRRDMNLNVPYYKEIDDIYSPNAIYERTSVFNTILRKRSNLINNSYNKLKGVMELCEIFKSHKIITYSQSSKFADTLTEQMNEIGEVEAVTYHSMLQSCPMINPETGEFYRYKSGAKLGQIKMFGTVSQKREALEGIIAGRYRILNTVDSFNEGVDIPDLSVIIISSGDCNKAKQFQRKTRGLTVTVDTKHKISFIVNLYLKNTILPSGKIIYSRDLEKLKSRQNPDDAIWLESINELKEYLTTLN